MVRAKHYCLRYEHTGWLKPYETKELRMVYSGWKLERAYLLHAIKVNKYRSLKGYVKIESALNYRQIPLYKKHHVQWNKLDKFQIDKFYLKNRIEPIIKIYKED